MDDEQILARGGTEEDINDFAGSNGGNLTKNDFMYEATRERIGQIIGEASMLWSEKPKGVFYSGKASELVDEIMTHIAYPLEHPDDKKNTCERCGAVWGYIHDCKKL